MKRAWLGVPRILPIAFFSALLICLSGCSFLSTSDGQRYIEYPVVAGDTVASVAKRFSVTENSIRQTNDISGSTLKPGNTILVPFHGQSLAKSRRDADGLKAFRNSQPAIEPNPASVKTLKLSKARKHMGRLVWPVKSGAITSKFGRRWLSFHEGIDISAEEGAKIRAAHDGLVVYSDDGLRGYGNLVVVKGDEILSVYAHNEKNLVDVGQRVDQGEPIALLGQSGKATGPHLHFEIRIKDQEGKNAAVDPLAFYKKGPS